MSWKPTNANDVRLTISSVIRNSNGGREKAPEIRSTGSIVVDDFSIDTEQDMDALSGVGRFDAKGISLGDLEHTFSFTVQGEDAELFLALAEDNGSANELDITVEMEDYRDTLQGAYAGTRSLSGSSGDPVEFEVSGMAKKRRNSQ